MNERLTIAIAAVAVIGLGVFAPSAQAARLGACGINGCEEGPPPAPAPCAEDDDNCEPGVEEEWNPTVTCELEEGEGLEELLECLLNALAHPPPRCLDTPSQPPPGGGGVQHVQQNNDDDDCVHLMAREDFRTWLLEPEPWPYGIGIEYLDGSELKRLALRERNSGIPFICVGLQEDFRMARVKMILEEPSGRGAVILRLDDDEFRIETAGFPTSIELNAELLRRLNNAGFSVKVASPYFFISRNVPAGRAGGIYYVEFGSTDGAIVGSDIALVPPDWEMPWFDGHLEDGRPSR